MTAHAPETIEDWRRLKSLGRPEFVRRYPHPFLLRQKLRRTSAVPTPAGDDWTERIAFETNVVDPDQIPAAPGPGRLRGARVQAIVKAPQNPFPERITVGRAGNCDVSIKDASVSKLHAVFVVKGPGEAALTDNRSANGTRLNGVPLEPGGTVIVRTGDSLIFGAVSAQFLAPERLFDLL